MQLGITTDVHKIKTYFWAEWVEVKHYHSMLIQKWEGNLLWKQKKTLVSF